MEQRKASIEVISITRARQFTLDKNVIGVNIQNNGTANVWVGWNEAASNKCICLPGSARPFGLGYPYFLAGQNLFIDFDSVGSKTAELIIIRDKGNHNC